jgi:hypothetical protein
MLLKPYVLDTIMSDLRRVAFAFDPRRRAILLAAGDKSGMSERRFYDRLLKGADARFDAHLAALERER